MADIMNTARLEHFLTQQVTPWEDLLCEAVKEQCGRRARILNLHSWDVIQQKQLFLEEILDDARNINPQQPIEITKNTVDVNEKIYSNNEGGEDVTTVKIVSSVGTSQGHNYQERVTSGIRWGVNTNVGLQFGLAQVWEKNRGTQTDIQPQNVLKNVEDKAELQSHHEETVKIPPRKKAFVKMTTYRVRYKLYYTMEYKISKAHSVSVEVALCGWRIPLCIRTVEIMASQLLHSLPGYREDEEFAYFTQEGELRWIADRMEVEKALLDL